MVRAEGLEPPRLSSREPKSRASTNSATPAEGTARQPTPGGAAYITRIAERTWKIGAYAKLLNRLLAGYEPPLLFPSPGKAPGCHSLLACRRAAGSWPARASPSARRVCRRSCGPKLRPMACASCAPATGRRAVKDSRRLGAMTARRLARRCVSSAGEELRVRLVNELPEPTTHPLARRPAAQCHGRRPAPHPAAGRARGELRLRVPPARRRHLLVPRLRPGPGRSRPLRRADRRGGCAGRRSIADVVLALAMPGEPGGAAPFVLVNGSVRPDIPVKAGERARLRLINATSARGFSLRIERHSPWVMAIDGQPAEPFVARDGRIALGPGSRVDLFVDMTQSAGTSASILAGLRRRAAGRPSGLPRRRRPARRAAIGAIAAAAQSAARPHRPQERAQGRAGARRRKAARSRRHRRCSRSAAAAP